MKKIQEQEETINGNAYSGREYDHYIAVDWSMKTMAIARMTRKSTQAKVI